MSANLAQKQLIDILVTSAVLDSDMIPFPWGPSKETEERLRKECQILGVLLWAANYGYYNDRNQKAETIPTYVFEPERQAPHVVLAAVELFAGAIDEDSPAAGTCDLIRRRLIGRLPVIEDEVDNLRHLI